MKFFVTKNMYSLCVSLTFVCGKNAFDYMLFPSKYTHVITAGTEMLSIREFRDARTYYGLALTMISFVNSIDILDLIGEWAIDGMFNSIV